MPEPLKNIYTPEFIEGLGRRVLAQRADFDPLQFAQAVQSGDWPELELKARMSKIASALHEYLRGDIEDNLILLSHVALGYRQSGLSGFEYMFLPEYVERYAGNLFKPAMTALENITATGSAEFAIRPFLLEQETHTLKQLEQWACSSDEHLRRLASEGCRPRLPWAIALPPYKRDPAPILPILQQLRADPSLYVRRSVANNLNDISKDNPDIALSLAEDWYGEQPETDWLVKHALRGLLKSGHTRALGLFGYAPPEELRVEHFGLGAEHIQFGEALTFTFAISSALDIGKLRLEYGLDFQKANGKLSRKVFKISEGDYQAKELKFSKQHKFTPITTRVHYPGAHRLAIIANGVELASEEFTLTM